MLEAAILFLCLLLMVFGKLTHITVRAIYISYKQDKILEKQGLLGLSDKLYK